KGAERLAQGVPADRRKRSAQGAWRTHQRLSALPPPFSPARLFGARQRSVGFAVLFEIVNRDCFPCAAQRAAVRCRHGIAQSSEFVRSRVCAAALMPRLTKVFLRNVLQRARDTVSACALYRVPDTCSAVAPAKAGAHTPCLSLFARMAAMGPRLRAPARGDKAAAVLVLRMGVRVQSTNVTSPGGAGKPRCKSLRASSNGLGSL